MVKVRFAPSPTGLLHVGNARTALINWLYARAHRGRFLLRIDDTDPERSREAYVSAIERDLLWFGLRWDERMRQSERLERYAAVADALRASGRLYPCYETPEELDFKRKLLLARHRPPIYDRAALALSEHDRAALEAEGRRPHWRFKLSDGEVGWDDLVRGRTVFRAENLSDPVVIRADGSFLYLLPSVIDDADLGITDVIRGEDHVTNTAAQVQMAEAIGAVPPRFAHLPLMTDIAGKGLSKRLGTAVALEQVQAEGVEPLALAALLAALGTGEPPRLCHSLDELAQGFDIGRYGRAAPKFDAELLLHLNARLLHESSYAEVADRLQGLGLLQANARFWEAVRGNIERLGDAGPWYEVCHGEVTPAIDDSEFARTALGLLPPEPWDETTWETWTTAVRAATGRRGKALFLPLRRALTGRDHGPELKRLLPLIGRERAERRLRGETAGPLPVAHLAVQRHAAPG